MATKILIDITDTRVTGIIEGNRLDVMASLGTYFSANPDVKELFKDTIRYVDEFEEVILGKNKQEESVKTQE